jgi:hypothetical protein
MLSCAHFFERFAAAYAIKRDRGACVSSAVRIAASCGLQKWAAHLWQRHVVPDVRTLAQQLPLRQQPPQQRVHGLAVPSGQQLPQRGAGARGGGSRVGAGRGWPVSIAAGRRECTSGVMRCRGGAQLPPWAGTMGGRHTIPKPTPCHVAAAIQVLRVFCRSHWRERMGAARSGRRGSRVTRGPVLDDAQERQHALQGGLRRLRRAVGALQGRRQTAAPAPRRGWCVERSHPGYLSGPCGRRLWEAGQCRAARVACGCHRTNISPRAWG